MFPKLGKTRILILPVLLLLAMPVSGKENTPVAKTEFLDAIGKIENQMQKSEIETTARIDSVRKDLENEIAEQNGKIETLQNDIRGLAEKLDEISELLRESRDGFDRSIIVNQDLLRKELEIKGLEISKTIAFVRETQTQLEKTAGQLAGEIEGRDRQYAEIRDAIKALETGVRQNADGLAETRTDLSNVNQTAQNKFRDISGTVSRGTLYWIAGVFAAAFLSLFFFIILKKTISKKTDTLADRIRDTKESLDAEAVKLDAKLVELIQARLAGESGPDHSFFLKAGLEIHRMRKRIEGMAEDAKGLKALKQSLKRLENDYNENGYEIIDLIGKPYVGGMTAVARFVPTENGKTEDSIITRVIKPQINYKGVLIQPAEVEVGKGD